MRNLINYYIYIYIYIYYEREVELYFSSISKLKRGGCYLINLTSLGGAVIC